MGDQGQDLRGSQSSQVPLIHLSRILDLGMGEILSTPSPLPHCLPAWLSLPQAEAHPAMLVVETLLAKDKEERPRREPSRDCRKLSEG